MSNNPTCPYCAESMQKADYLDPLCYKRPVCGSESPAAPRGLLGIEKDWEEAFNAAMRRTEPENRVLTLEEIRETQSSDLPFWKGAPLRLEVEEVARLLDALTDKLHDIKQVALPPPSRCSAPTA